jgi:hypothetical protein
MMPNSQTTNTQSWKSAGWRITPYSLPYLVTDPPLGFRDLVEARTPDAATEQTQDEPAFGVHIREAARAVSRIVR